MEYGDETTGTYPELERLAGNVLDLRRLKEKLAAFTKGRRTRRPVQRPGCNWTRIPTVGRDRKKLAKLLTEQIGVPLGIEIQPEDIGRSNPHHRRWEDTVAWEVFCDDGKGHSVNISSWDTVKDCARNGIVVVEDRWLQYEVHAKPKSNLKREDTGC